MVNNHHIPIYRKLINQYRDEIIEQKFLPGGKIDSITQLCKKHRISRETAKLVLKSLAKEGLIIQKPGKGSFVADPAPKKGIWGIVMPYFSVQTEELLNAIIQKASMQEKQVEYFIDNNHWKEEIRLVGSLISEGFEAVLVIPTFDETDTASFYRNLVTSGTLVALLDRTMAGSWFPYVIQSYDVGVTRAVEYLLCQTSKNMLFVGNEILAGRNMVQETMEKTFMNRVVSSDSTRKAKVESHISNLDEDYLRKENIGGILCSDDLVAIRLLGRLKKKGIQIPGDISLVSYGNTELCLYSDPPITAVDCRFKEMAEKAADIIQSHNRGNDTSFSQFIIQPDLIIRET